ncbi:membrane hypothetical protein [Candidatus Sulfopaludibacter sp. SbA4]|nr:membrane hypothetical protein [Candidatus Sulfopaludibacter sp. SbA4]
MPKSAAWIAWILSTLLIVFGAVRPPYLDAGAPTSWTVVKIFTAALALLVVPTIHLVRSNERFGCGLLLLVGLQAVFCVNCIVAALGGYM